MKNAEVTQSMKYSQPFEKIIEQTKNNTSVVTYVNDPQGSSHTQQAVVNSHFGNLESVSMQ